MWTERSAPLKSAVALSGIHCTRDNGSSPADLGRHVLRVQFADRAANLAIAGAISEALRAETLEDL
jgi:hypothetical protein